MGASTDIAPGAVMIAEDSCPVRYSVCSAATGSSRAADNAGYTPKPHGNRHADDHGQGDPGYGPRDGPAGEGGNGVGDHDA